MLGLTFFDFMFPPSQINCAWRYMFLKAYPVLGFTLPALVPIFTQFFTEACSGKFELIGIIPFSSSKISYEPKYLEINLSSSFLASELLIISFPNLVNSIKADVEL